MVWGGGHAEGTGIRTGSASFRPFLHRMVGVQGACARFFSPTMVKYAVHGQGSDLHLGRPVAGDALKGPISQGPQISVDDRRSDDLQRQWLMDQIAHLISRPLSGWREGNLGGE